MISSWSSLITTHFILSYRQFLLIRDRISNLIINCSFCQHLCQEWLSFIMKNAVITMLTFFHAYQLIMILSLRNQLMFLSMTTHISLSYFLKWILISLDELRKLSQMTLILKKYMIRLPNKLIVISIMISDEIQYKKSFFSQLIMINCAYPKH